MILLYSSISMVHMLKKTQRDTYRNFISDPTIFTPAKIYRPNDDPIWITTTSKNVGLCRY